MWEIELPSTSPTGSNPACLTSRNSSTDRSLVKNPRATSCFIRAIRSRPDSGVPGRRACFVARRVRRLLGEPGGSGGLGRRGLSVVVVSFQESHRLLLTGSLDQHALERLPGRFA